MLCQEKHLTEMDKVKRKFLIDLLNCLKEKLKMVRRIKASAKNMQNTDTVLEQCTQPNFTIDEVVDLLSNIKELRGMKIHYVIEPEGNIVFLIGGCEYVMAEVT